MAGTIEVHKTPTTLAVCRTDGRPLQAQIIHRREDAATVRLTVFTEPVQSLALRRLTEPSESGPWVITQGARPRGYRELLQLVETILSFSLAKQRPESMPHRQATLRTNRVDQRLATRSDPDAVNPER